METERVHEAWTMSELDATARLRGDLPSTPNCRHSRGPIQ
jgi:hypothetical protein